MHLLEPGAQRASRIRRQLVTEPVGQLQTVRSEVYVTHRFRDAVRDRELTGLAWDRCPGPAIEAAEFAVAVAASPTASASRLRSDATVAAVTPLSHLHEGAAISEAGYEQQPSREEQLSA
jgi:hypothetical protein